MKRFFRYFLIVVLSLTYLFTFTSVVYSAIHESHEAGEGWSANAIYGSKLEGETFTASSSHYINGVWLQAGGRGSTPDAIIHLKATSGGVPTGGDLESGTFDTSSCTYIDDLWQHTWEYFEFDAPYFVTSGTKYFIGVSCPTGDINNCIYIMSDTNVSDEFADGVNYRSSDSGASYPVSYANDDWTFMNDDEAPASVPTVIIYGVNQYTNGADFTAHATIAEGAILEAYFQLGTVTETYTDNVTPTIYADGDITGFTDNLTVGQTYYLRAIARNASGWGYSQEISFDYNPISLVVYCGSAYVGMNYSGNFSATWNVWLSEQLTANVTSRCSANLDWSDPVTVYLQSSAGGEFVFSTYNGTSEGYGVLLPDTTYYYGAYATYNGTDYYSQIRSFHTENVTYPDMPSVALLELTDVSSSYPDVDYAFKLSGRVTTDNNSDTVLNQGFAFSLSANLDGYLLPLVYRFPAKTLNPDGSFNLVLTFTNSSWYSGQTLYIKAYVTTPYYDKVYSATSSITPTDSQSTGGAETPTLDIAELVNETKSKLGMTNMFGTWAFMGLIILIVSLVFGIAYVVTNNDSGKKAIGISWFFTTIAVVGAFLFTGQLGIWPLIILAGGLVVLIMLVVGNRILGGGSIDG